MQSGMVGLGFAFLLVQLSSVLSFPWIASIYQLQKKFVSSKTHAIHPLSTTDSLSNREYSHRMIINIACWDGSYYINATIGTPPQEFKLSIFLGLPDDLADNTWIPSKHCDQQACQNHRKYDSSASTTYSPNGEDFVDRITTAVGFSSNDTICLGNICAGNQTFGEVTDEGLWQYFAAAPFDGFIDIDPHHTLFHSMLTEQMETKVISLWLTENMAQEKATCGKLILGGVDNEFYSGSITWVPLIHDRSSFLFDSVTVGNTSLGCYNDCLGTVMIDLYPIINGPTASIKKLHDLIGAVKHKKSKHYSVPCEKLSSLPQITFTITGKAFILNGTDYMEEVGGTCWSLFDDRIHDNGWIFGSPFLLKAYTSIDVDRNMIGFAHPKRV